MKYALVFWMISTWQDQNSTHHVVFDNKELCENARQVILQEHRSRPNRSQTFMQAICVQVTKKSPLTSSDNP